MASQAPRDRFADDEWALVEKGLCPVLTEYGNRMSHVEFCEQPAMPGDWYRACAEHGQEMRADDEARGIFRP